MDDTSGPVRDAAAEALGTLLKLLGERTMAPFVDQLDKIKLDKVRFVISEIYELLLLRRLP